MPLTLGANIMYPRVMCYKRSKYSFEKISFVLAFYFVRKQWYSSSPFSPACLTASSLSPLNRLPKCFPKPMISPNRKQDLFKRLSWLGKLLGSFVVTSFKIAISHAQCLHPQLFQTLDLPKTGCTLLYRAHSSV